MRISSTDRRTSFGLAAILILAAALRLNNLTGPDVISDEAFSIWVASKPLPGLFAELVGDYVHPPLHYLLLHFLLPLFGVSVAVARLPSVAFGVLSVWLLYRLADRLLGRRAALLAALMLAVSQLGVRYSQNARPYSLWVSLGLAASYCLIRALDAGGGRGWWMTYSVALTLTIYTHYFGFLLLLAMCAFLVVRKGTRLEIRAVPWWPFGVASSASLACFAPWMLSGVLGAVQRNPKIVEARPLIEAAHWWSPFSMLAWFNNAQAGVLGQGAPVWAHVLGPLIFTLPACWALRKAFVVRDPAETRANGGVLFCFVLAFTQATAVWLIGWAGVQFYVRYALLAVPFYYALAAHGLLNLPMRVPMAVLALAVIASSIPGLIAYERMPFTQIQEALAFLRQQYEPGDCVLSVWERGDRPLEPEWETYYRNDPLPRVVTRREIVGAKRLPGRLIVFLFDVSFAAPDAEQRALERELSTRYQMVVERRYYRLKVSVFEPRN